MAVGVLRLSFSGRFYDKLRQSERPELLRFLVSLRHFGFENIANRRIHLRRFRVERKFGGVEKRFFCDGHDLTPIRSTSSSKRSSFAGISTATVGLAFGR